ncbi:MAG: AraC family transcriptional regulator, partial [Clostridium sp.]
DISDEVGFSHVRYLNKNFKIYYDCTPLQYRKKNKLSEEALEKLKNIEFLEVQDALDYLSYDLEDYERFNYENKLWKIHIDMDENIDVFNPHYKEVINIGEAFDLLIEDNKDILEGIQEEIHFNYGRIENLFTSDMGIFPNSEFCNWNRAKSVIEYLDYINLKPIIVLDNSLFTVDRFKYVINSFFEYFSKVDFIDLSSFKFQFSICIDDNIKVEISKLITINYNCEILEETFSSVKNLNKLYDTAFMIPYIIHNTIFNKFSLDFLRAFDVLEKEVYLTNEVFIGAPGLVNDMGIKKPSYYAYYLLSKLGDEIVSIAPGCIVTKKDNKFCILLYSHNDDIEKELNSTEIDKKVLKPKGSKKKLSLNIVNVKNASRIVTYEVNEKIGSSYNYWLSMGSPDRLNKEEKEIIHKASFPQIDFKYSKKSTVLNIVTELKGYGAKLIVIKNLK